MEDIIARLRDEADLIRAEHPPDGKQNPMPRDEFLTLLGFDPALPNDQLPLMEVYNECLHIMTNPKWRELPEDKRHAALQMGNVFMSNMHGGR